MKLEDLKGVIVTIILVGILLGAAFLILREFAGTLDLDSSSATNETFTFPTGEGNYAGHNSSTISCFKDFSVTEIRNETGDVWANETGSLIIAPGNYSYESTTGKIWNITPLPDGGWDIRWKISYTFKYSNSSACKGLEETITATEKIQTWLGILVVMFIIGILVFLIFKVTSRGGFGGGSESGFGRIKLGRFGGSGDSGTAEI